MACQIAHDRDAHIALLYCGGTNWAIGPVFTDSEDHDANERAEAFVRWLRTTEMWVTFEKEPIQGGRRDPRDLTDAGLQQAYLVWLDNEPLQWEREEAALFAEE